MNNIISFILSCVGVFIGLAVADLTFKKADNELLKQTKQILRECESKLPRNENCIIIAVPEKTND